MKMKINEAQWSVIASAEINGCGIWIRALDTDCGTLYFVEHEGKNKELVEDYIGFCEYQYARKKFNKAFTKLNLDFLGL